MSNYSLRLFNRQFMKMSSNESRQLHRFFAYGTLKRGQPNHEYLNNKSLGQCNFVSDVLTILKYPLIIATRWNLPFLIDFPGTGEKIQGELYEADDGFMEWLDDFENLYVKKEISVEILKSLSSLNPNFSKDHMSSPCYAYFLTNYPKGLMGLPFYSSYDCYGDHKRIYSQTDDDSTPEMLMENLMKETQKGL